MVDVARIVDAAFAGDRVKGAGVGLAEILDLPGVGHQGLRRGEAENLRNRFPGRPAGGAAQDGEFGNPSGLVEPGGQLREAELFAVVTQTLMAAETAAGKGGVAVAAFAARGYEGKSLALADRGDVVQQVRVLDEAQDHFANEAIRHVPFRVVHQRRQMGGEGDDLDDLDVVAIFPEAADFGSATFAFLDDADAGRAFASHPFPPLAEER
jgi:hypothetical protein